MTYLKTIQSCNAKIDNLEVKNKQTFARLVVSCLILVPTVIFYHVIGFNSNAALLSQLFLLLYLIGFAYFFLYRNIKLSILEICPEIILKEEIFIRITSRYGIKKGMSSLIKICARRYVNKFRPITQGPIPHSTKISPGKNQQQSKGNTTKETTSVTLDKGSQKKVKEVQDEDNKKNTKRGRDSIPMPEGFYEKAEELTDNFYPEEWTQDNVVYELIEEFFDGDKSKRSTVYRRIRSRGLWG